MTDKCPVCGAPRTQQETALAGTRVGVQCRRCWSHFRDVPRADAARTPRRDSAAARRAPALRRAS